MMMDTKPIFVSLWAFFELPQGSLAFDPELKSRVECKKIIFILVNWNRLGRQGNLTIQDWQEYKILCLRQSCCNLLVK